MRSPSPSFSSPRPLHVVLEHRSATDFQSYVQFLRAKQHTNQLPAKVSIFSDFQWKGQIVSAPRRVQLFEKALSQTICGEALKHLEIDLLCDLFLPEDVDGLSLNWNLSNYYSDDKEETSNWMQRLQVLPCSLLTRLLKNAPKLETLVLKELFLSGSPQEVQELVDCLQSHPTLRRIDLRWKLTGSAASMSVLEPLIAGIARMPQLREVNLMIPHGCPALSLLPQSKSLRTVKLTVEAVDDPATLLRGWKTVRHLEVSSFQILQDSSALLELIRDTTNSHLEHLCVIDHNIFRRPRKNQTTNGKEERQKRERKPARIHKSTNKSTFAQDLANALKSNRTLQHLHLSSKSPRRTRRSSMSQRNEQEQDHREVFGEMVEHHNFVLSHLEISHGGLQLSAPNNNRQKKEEPDNQYFKDKQFPPIIENKVSWSQLLLEEEKLDFFLKLNREGYRSQLLSESNQPQHQQQKWYRAMRHYQQDTASLFSLIQASPAVVESLLRV